MYFRSIMFLSFILVVAPLSAHGDPVIVDAESGALFDAIVDGFPGQFDFDGEPDLAGNQLATAFKLGVTEERGLAEFPLSALAGISPQQLSRVTLTFNIDDVLSTFGPGTTFNGKAARTLLIHVYLGDGAIQLADYKQIAGEPHTVDTTAHGAITDNSLRNSGAIFFDVDITADTRTVLGSGASHLGILWRTTDSPTGTSLDNLGDGSVEPPGTGGSRLPYLTMEVAEEPTATATSAAPTATPPLPPSSTPTATATPSTPASVACIGDCNHEGIVTVNELVLMINIALGSDEIASCLAGDGNGDEQITVDELVAALAVALGGCGDQ